MKQAGKLLSFALVACALSARSSAQCQSWSSSGFAALGANGPVHAYAYFDDGTGPALYVGGTFTSIGGVSANHLARWNGVSWSALGAGTPADVLTMCVWNDAAGPCLLIGGVSGSGTFQTAELDRWVSAGLSPYMIGVSGHSVNALTVYDDGHGLALYIGGWINLNTPSSGIVRWDGTTLSALQGGLIGQANALRVFDDGSGKRLWIGGYFSHVNGQGGPAAFNVATWDGTHLMAPAGFDLPVIDFAVYDSGTGPALYAAGFFTSPTPYLARWTGSAWAAVPGAPDNAVRSLAVFDDGSGTQLFAAGMFTHAGGASIGHIAKWNGSAWSALGGGLDDSVEWGGAMQSFADVPGSPPALLVGGAFSTPTPHLARWIGCQASASTPLCAGDGTQGACPCANSGAAGRGCANSAHAAGAQLTTLGATNPDTLVLASSGELATSLSIFLQGDRAITAVPFGDGLRCVAGALKRLYAKNAMLGNISAPGAGDTSVHLRSLALGDALVSGSTRYYQVYYRDADPSFCPAPSGSTFNITNGVAVVW